MLNGTTVAKNGDHRYVRNYSFTPQIGANVMRISGLNLPNGLIDPTQNAAGVIYRGSVTYDLAHLLTVQTRGSGSGVVKGIGIECGSDCTERYGDGKTIPLTVQPAAGSRFTG